MAAASQEDDRIRSARAAIFVLAAIYIFGNPLLKQGCGVHDARLRSWEMFGKIGLGLVDATFYQRDEGGRDTELPALRGPAAVIHGQGDLGRVGAAHCAKLAPGSDVRAVARISQRHGWRTFENKDRNFCPVPGGVQVRPPSPPPATTSDADPD